MAVYKRSYRGYTGELTPRWSRFLILMRYASRGIFRSRMVTALFVICFFYPLVNGGRAVPESQRPRAVADEAEPRLTCSISTASSS